MQYAPLAQCGMHHRPLDVCPVLGASLADCDDVERHLQRTQCASEAHHLGVPVQRIVLRLSALPTRPRVMQRLLRRHPLRPGA